LIKKAEEESKREFFCEEDAKAEIEKFQQKNKSKFHTFSSEIIEVEKTIKKNKRGRYKKEEIPLKEKRYIVNLNLFKMSQLAIRTRKMWSVCFDYYSQRYGKIS